MYDGLPFDGNTKWFQMRGYLRTRLRSFIGEQIVDGGEGFCTDSLSEAKLVAAALILLDQAECEVGQKPSGFIAAKQMQCSAHGPHSHQCAVFAAGTLDVCNCEVCTARSEGEACGGCVLCLDCEQVAD